jgi:hypothetical protein
MSKRRLRHLSWPPRQYRADIHAEGFESVTDSETEDGYRDRALKKLAGTHQDLAERALLLAKQLAGDDPDTIASSCHMRELRIRVVGHLWPLVEDQAAMNVLFATVAAPAWRYTPEQLLEADAKAICNSFRVDLHRAGSGDADGWIFATMHGSWDAATHEFQIHFHLLAAGGMIEVIDALRKRPKYRSSRGPPDGWDPVHQRVRIERKPLTNLPSPITYVVQSFWDAKTTHSRLHGRDHGQGRKRRIPEPYHAMSLLWLDRWTLDDLCVRVNLNIIGSSLRISK